MNYIGLVGKYNPIITNQNIPVEYQNDTIEEYNYPDNYCHLAHKCRYANDDNFTCLYSDNCPLIKDD